MIGEFGEEGDFFLISLGEEGVVGLELWRKVELWRHKSCKD